MAEQDNVAILKDAYDYWNENKEKAFENWLNILSDDVHFRSLADGQRGVEFTRECNCKNDVLRYFKELSSEWEMIHYTVDEYIAQGDRVVAIGNCRWRYVKTGKEVETPKVDIITMTGGRIVEFFELYDTKKVIECTE